MSKKLYGRKVRKPECSTKKAYYLTQGRALKVIREIKIENAQAAIPAEVEPESVYRCDECGGWHLSSQKRGVSVG